MKYLSAIGIALQFCRFESFPGRTNKQLGTCSAAKTTGSHMRRIHPYFIQQFACFNMPFANGKTTPMGYPKMPIGSHTHTIRHAQLMGYAYQCAVVLPSCCHRFTYIMPSITTDFAGIGIDKVKIRTIAGPHNTVGNRYCRNNCIQNSVAETHKFPLIGQSLHVHRAEPKITLGIYSAVIGTDLSTPSI
ncbi:hypothetical protein D3C81_1115830 [compost metagenome]